MKEAKFDKANTFFADDYFNNQTQFADFNFNFTICLGGGCQ